VNRLGVAGVDDEGFETEDDAIGVIVRGGGEGDDVHSHGTAPFKENE
jgi:hypothetical protein